MRNRSIRHLATVAALALAALALACDATPSLAAPSKAPSTAQPPATRPSTHRPASCLGAVVHTVLADTSGPLPPVCITVGGVLRLENLGPGLLSVDPAGKVSCFYAAGVHVCRLIYTGTVKFTITNTSGVRTLTVTVAGAVTPPLPSPACTPPATFTLDAAEGALPWVAVCVKLGTIMRVVNLGPEGFTASPAGAVSCWYEAAVRECRFVKAATVTFTTQTEPGSEIRTFIVVAIK